MTSFSVIKLTTTPDSTKPVKNLVFISYFILIHIVLLTAVIKFDALARLSIRLGLQKEIKVEANSYYLRDITFQTRIDKQIHSGSIFFIGDSTFHSLRTQNISPNAVNFGIGGDTTKGLLQRLPHYKSLEEATSIVILIGFNDFKYRKNDEIISNFTKILETLPTGVPRLACSLLPINESIRPEFTSYNSEKIRPLNESLKTLVSKTDNTTFLNLHSSFTNKNGELSPKLAMADGIHLSPQGNALLTDLLSKALQEEQFR